MERELKLVLDAPDYLRLASSLHGYAGDRWLANHYFDTFDRALRSKGAMLRIRETEDARIVGLKQAVSIRGGEFEAAEREAPLEDRDWLRLVRAGGDVGILDHPVVREAFALAGADVLPYQGVLRVLRKRYDYVLVDCPPSLGLLTVNALTAADGVLIPLECEYFALRGMALLMDTIEKVREDINPDLEIVGILATMYDARTVHGREVLGRVEDAFGGRVFRTVIAKTIRFAEAPVAGESILTYAGSSSGAVAYRELAKEVLAS